MWIGSVWPCSRQLYNSKPLPYWNASFPHFPSFLPKSVVFQFMWIVWNGLALLVKVICWQVQYLCEPPPPLKSIPAFVSELQRSINLVSLIRINKGWWSSYNGQGWKFFCQGELSLVSVTINPKMVMKVFTEQHHTVIGFQFVYLKRGSIWAWWSQFLQSYESSVTYVQWSSLKGHSLERTPL